MKRQVFWHASAAREAIEAPVCLPERPDGIFVYRITADDKQTWLDLHVRVRLFAGDVPNAYYICLHTAYPDDYRGDRTQDFTSSLLGDRFVGYIHNLTDPHPRFWQELETQFLEWDAKARADYAKDMEQRPVAPSALPAELELKNCYRVVGTGGNVVIIAADSMARAIKGYEQHVRDLATRIGHGAEPIYKIATLERMEPFTLIR